VRVVILSDTHGALDARIADLVGDCDLAVHGGDVGSAAVLDALHARVERLIAVRGNNDVAAKWSLEERHRLRGLPEQAEVDLPGGLLVVIHGHQARSAATRHASLRSRFPLARAVVYGHSHRLACDQDSLPWVLNPGAAGAARTFGGPSCMILTATPESWRVRVERFPPVGAAARR